MLKTLLIRRKLVLVIALISSLFIGLSFIQQKSLLISKESRVSAILSSLHDIVPLHYIDKLDTHKIRIGKELVTQGYTLLNGERTSRISPYFVCTDCHNQVIEDYDLLNPTPEKRLSKATKDNIPFLQATTFYGLANRTTFYNDDYHKKYGDLVNSARDTLANAIQLCATECSSGRPLEDWEIDAILHYINSLDYKISDLKLTTNELERLNNSQSTFGQKTALLKSKYSTASKAHFIPVQSKNERKYGIEGNPINGKNIFVLSCMHCHAKEKDISKFKLDTIGVSIKFLKLSLKQNSSHSIYNVVREGTYIKEKHKAYMPHYTADRMSEEQLEDLVSFIVRSNK